MSLIINYNANLRKRAAELRKAGVLSEVLLWNKINNKKINGLNFDRQRVIGNYIVDFFCPETGVVVEIDGYTHDYKIEYDERRENYIKSLGLDTINIADKEVKRNINEVVYMLLAHPLLQSPICERKCIFLALPIVPPRQASLATPPERGIILCTNKIKQGVPLRKIGEGRLIYRSVICINIAAN